MVTRLPRLPATLRAFGDGAVAYVDGGGVCLAPVGSAPVARVPASARAPLRAFAWDGDDDRPLVLFPDGVAAAPS